MRVSMWQPPQMEYNHTRPYLLSKNTILLKAEYSLRSFVCIAATKNLASAFLDVKNRKKQPGGLQCLGNGLLLRIPTRIENDFKAIHVKLWTIQQDRLVAERVGTAS